VKGQFDQQVAACFEAQQSVVGDAVGDLDELLANEQLIAE
jgi:hypothetical protein